MRPSSTRSYVLERLGALKARMRNTASSLTRQERHALVLIAALFVLGATVRWLRLRGVL